MRIVTEIVPGAVTGGRHRVQRWPSGKVVMQIGCAGSNGLDKSEPVSRPIASSRWKSNASMVAPGPMPVLLDPNLAGPLHHQLGGGRIVERILDRGQQVAQRGFAVSHCRTWRIL